MPITLPSTPDPNRAAQISGQIRTVIAIATGFGLAIPTISDTQLNAYVQAALIVGSVAAWAATSVWSWWQHKQAGIDAHAGAVASAQAGTPLKVVS